MHAYADLLLLLVIVLDVYMVSTTRLRARVYACALQGIIHGLLPLTLSGTSLAATRAGAIHLFLVTLGTLTLKAVVIPVFMLKAVRDSGVRREAAPHVSLHWSLLIAAACVLVAFAMSASAVSFAQGPKTLALPAGLSTLLIGFFLTINGTKELTQIIGYQVTQNGVFVLGQTFLGELPMLVELGVLLDVLVAVMLTGLFIAQSSATGKTHKHKDVVAGAGESAT